MFPIFCAVYKFDTPTHRFGEVGVGGFSSAAGGDQGILRKSLGNQRRSHLSALRSPSYDPLGLF